jgi:hypothetical protein
MTLVDCGTRPMSSAGAEGGLAAGKSDPPKKLLKFPKVRDRARARLRRTT